MRKLPVTFFLHAARITPRHPTATIRPQHACQSAQRALRLARTLALHMEGGRPRAPLCPTHGRPNMKNLVLLIALCVIGWFVYRDYSVKQVNVAQNQATSTPEPTPVATRSTPAPEPRANTSVASPKQEKPLPLKFVPKTKQAARELGYKPDQADYLVNGILSE